MRTRPRRLLPAVPRDPPAAAVAGVDLRDSFKNRLLATPSVEDMTDLARLDGTVFAPGSPGYEANRRPVNVAYHDVRPRLVVSCRSTSDVVAVVSYAAAAGERLAVRGGGHCFAGRSSTDGIVLDLSELNDVTVAADGVATIGAGARLRSEEHTSELQSRENLVCRLLLEKKKEDGPRPLPGLAATPRRTT